MRQGNFSGELARRECSQNRPAVCRLRGAIGSLLGFIALAEALAAAESGAIPLRLLRANSLADWTAQSNANVLRWESPVWSVDFAWDEAVPSWNVSPGSAWTVELRAIGTKQADVWYPLGTWCSDTNRAPRSSWTGASLAGAKVLTDTLRLDQPAVGIQARLTPGQKTSESDLFQFTVSLMDSRAQWPEPASFVPAWGTGVAVPVLSQADYPDGVNLWCSPTSVAMLLGWWTDQRGISDQPIEVPAVARSVFDPGWPGTGNWAFNMAYVGQLPGLRSAVARLAGLSDLERWLGAGLPVVASVSYGLLKGGDQPLPGDGHLVVVWGFTATGHVLVNDPGVRASRVQKIIPRAAFRAAWQQSRNTAYLIWPAGTTLPAGGDGRW